MRKRSWSTCARRGWRIWRPHATGVFLAAAAAEVVIGGGSLVNNVSAATVEWAQPVNGNFNDAVNWNPAVAPGAGDVAGFNNGPAANYQVTFSGLVTTDGLRVGSGSVLLNMFENTYTITGSVSSPSVTVAQPGALTSLFVSNGRVLAADALVGGNGGAGLISVMDSTWNQTGALDLGRRDPGNVNGGNGTLRLSNSSSATAQTVYLGRGIGDGALEVTDGSQMTVSGGIFVGGDESSVGNAGIVRVTNNSQLTAATMRVWPGGTVSLAGPGPTLKVDQLTLSGGLLSGAGVVVGNISAGSGTVAAEQTLTLTISGGLGLADESSLLVEFGDSTGQVGLVDVNSSVTLDGRLMIKLTEALVSQISAGSEFTVLQADQLSGTFDNLQNGRVRVMDDLGSFAVRQEGNAVVLSDFVAEAGPGPGNGPGGPSPIPLPAGVWSGLVTVGVAAPVIWRARRRVACRA